MNGELPGGIRRVWGRPVRLQRGHLTHWAGKDLEGTTRLAHDAYVWTDNLRDPEPGARECERCKRKQPFFLTFPETQP